MNFIVSVLKVRETACLPKNLRENLLENATYIRRFNVWLFEGDWEIELEDMVIEHNITIDCLGEIVVPCLGGLSQKKIEKLVKDQVKL